MKKKTAEQFIIEAHKKHRNLYDYSKVKYINSSTKVEVVCKQHGSFFITPSNHISKNPNNLGRCPKCTNEIHRGGKLAWDEIKNRCIKQQGNKYDYSLVEYCNLNKKEKIICPDHGIFMQSFLGHLYHRNGCPQCAKEKRKESNTYTNEEYISKASLQHNNFYDYSKTIYTNAHEKIDIICPKHGLFSQVAFGHLYGYGCPSCGNVKSQYESYLLDFLKKHNIKTIERCRDIITPYEIDVYLPELKIGIEINGLYWHGETKLKDKNYHLNKLNLCQAQGIQLLQYTDLDFIKHKKIILSQIKSNCKINKYRIYARNCEVRIIDSKLKSKFLSKYHFQGNDKSKINLGLFYKNRLVSCMTFCNLRIALGSKSKEGCYELSRFCNNYNTTIVGGANKLLSFFERQYTPYEVVTFANKCRSNGNIYKMLGFEFVHDSNPNYWYYKKQKYDHLYHRYNFRKNILQTKLDIFNPNISEWENMKNNGWDRYWDCGNKKFKKQYSY